MKYRADIDGLRAVAVLSVVFFHGGVELLQGGFVGVDVFFVISGYLITKVIHEELKSGTFSLITFYERRIRRILPALVVVWFFSTIAGLLLLTPKDLADFGTSLGAAALFVSNHYFYATAGYFDGPAHEKPLLHTWSLSVEEQFYLFWPIVMWLIVGYFKRIPLWSVLAAVTVASLLLAERWLQWDPSRAFYLLPARSWELAIGAAAALYGKWTPANLRVGGVLAAVGLALIICSIFGLSPSSRFPGIFAAPACLGTALLILFGGHAGSWVGTLLSLSPMQYIGKLSYSLYLWHWPVFVFARYGLDRPLSLAENCAAMVASLAISHLSFRFVESPFRRRSETSGPRSGIPVLRFGSVMLLVSTLTGAFLAFSHGLPERLDQDLREIEQQSRTLNPLSATCSGAMNAAGNADKCGFGKQAAGDDFDIVVFGDSHADAFVPAMSLRVDQTQLSGRQVTHTGCPPLLGVKVHKVGAEVKANLFCNELQLAMKAFVESSRRLKLVVLVGRWDLYTEASVAHGEEGHPIFLHDDVSDDDSIETTRAVMARQLLTTVRYFTSRGIDVMIVGGVPPLGQSRLRCVMRHGLAAGSSSICAPAAAEIDNRLSFSNMVISTLASREPGVTYFLPSSVLCGAEYCRVVEGMTYLYSDDDHLNAFGARYLSGYLKLPKSISESRL